MREATIFILHAKAARPYPGGMTSQTTNDLDAEVARMVGAGFSVESRTDSQAVLSKRARIGWLWNTVLAVLTGGLWLIVVVYRVINRKTERVVLTVGADGRVRRS